MSKKKGELPESNREPKDMISNIYNALKGNKYIVSDYIPILSPFYHPFYSLVLSPYNLYLKTIELVSLYPQGDVR